MRLAVACEWRVGVPLSCRRQHTASDARCMIHGVHTVHGAPMLRTSAPGLGPPLPRLRRDWAHPCHMWLDGSPFWVAGQVRAALVRADGTLTAAALPIVIGETVRSSSTLSTESTHSTLACHPVVRSGPTESTHSTLALPVPCIPIRGCSARTALVSVSIPFLLAQALSCRPCARSDCKPVLRVCARVRACACGFVCESDCVCVCVCVCL